MGLHYIMSKKIFYLEAGNSSCVTAVLISSLLILHFYPFYNFIRENIFKILILSMPLHIYRHSSHTRNLMSVTVLRFFHAYT